MRIHSLPKYTVTTLCLALALWLAGCNDDRKNRAQAMAQQQPLPELVTVTGQVTYDRVPTDSQSGLHNFEDIHTQPVRMAQVQAIQNGIVIAETNTNAYGEYELQLSVGSEIAIRVNALVHANEQWSVAVEDNTHQNALYHIQGTEFRAIANQRHDLHASAGWLSGSYQSHRLAAPFAIADTLLSAYQKLANITDLSPLPPLAVAWSPNNIAIDGDKNEGFIAASHYQNQGLLPTIYLVGHLDNDADEYDTSVILHEFSHYLLDWLSRADSVGGPHSHGNQLDVRVAFNEAISTVLGAALNENSVYSDVFGSRQILVQRFDLENSTSETPGWFSSESNALLLYDLLDGQNEESDSIELGLEGFIQILRSVDFLSFDGAISIYTFLDTAKKEFPAYSQAISSLASNYGLNTTDPYARGETNAGGSAVTLPIYHELSINQTVQLCSDSDYTDFNGIDVHSLALLNIPSTGLYTLRAQKSGPGIAFSNPEIVVYHQGESKMAGFSTQLDVESVNHYLEQGTYVVDVFERSNADYDPQSGGLACFELEISPGAPDEISAKTHSDCFSLASLSGDPRCRSTFRPEESGIQL